MKRIISSILLLSLFISCQRTDLSNIAYDMDPIYPAAAGDFTATPINTTTIQLSWKDNSLDEEGYNIYYSKGSVKPDVPQLETAADETTAVIESLEPYTYYSFWLEAFNGRIAGPHSYAFAAAGFPAEALTGVSLNSTTSNEMLISWNTNTADTPANTISIYYSYKNSRPDVPAYTLPAAAGSQLVTNLYPGTVYYLWIQSANTAGSSEFISLAKSTSGPTYGIPDKPVDVNISALDAHTVDISWTDNSYNELGFRLYQNIENRRPGENPPYIILPAGTQSVQISNLLKGARYYYWLDSYNDFGDSYDISFNIITPGMPVAPSSFNSVSTNHRSMNLSWQDNDNSESRFSIFYSTLEIKPGAPALTSDYGKTDILVPGLEPKTSYFFWVEAFNANGVSSPLSLSNRTALPPILPVEKIIDDSYNLLAGGALPFYRQDGRMTASLTMSSDSPYAGSSSMRWTLFATNTGMWGDVWLRNIDNEYFDLMKYTTLHIALRADSDCAIKLIIAGCSLLAPYDIIALKASDGWVTFNIPLPGSLISAGKDLNLCDEVMDIRWQSSYEGNPAVITPASPFNVNIYIDELYFD